MNSQQFIAKMAELGLKFSFVVAGGGVGLFDLFRVPGCSCVMGEGRILYNEQSFENFLILAPNKYVCDQTASIMAHQLSCYQPGHVCLAITAALKSNRERRGKDRANLCVSIATGESNITRALYVDLIQESREDQDAFLSDKALTFVMESINNATAHA